MINLHFTYRHINHVNHNGMSFGFTLASDGGGGLVESLLLLPNVNPEHLRKKSNFYISSWTSYRNKIKRHKIITTSKAILDIQHNTGALSKREGNLVST